MPFKPSYYSARESGRKRQELPSPTVKDKWDKLAVISGFAASMLVPLVIAYTGQVYTSGLKQRDRQVQYVELAVSILKEKPDKTQGEVREWAADIIDKYSEVPLTKKARQQLISVETLRLKRVVDKRSQTHEMIRQIIARFLGFPQ